MKTVIMRTLTHYYYYASAAVAAGCLSALYRIVFFIYYNTNQLLQPSYVSPPTAQFMNATSLPSSLRLYRLILPIPKMGSVIIPRPSLPSFPSAAACICPQNKFRCAVSNILPADTGHVLLTEQHVLKSVSCSLRIFKNKTKTSLGFPRALLLLIVVDSLRKPWDPCKAKH